MADRSRLTRFAELAGIGSLFLAAITLAVSPEARKLIFGDQAKDHQTGSPGNVVSSVAPTGSIPPITSSSPPKEDKRTIIKAEPKLEPQVATAKPEPSAAAPPCTVREGGLYEALTLNGKPDCVPDKVAYSSRSNWVELVPVTGTQPLRVWVAPKIVQAGNTVKIRVKFASRDNVPVQLWLGATANRVFVNEWTLDAGSGECHASSKSAQSIPKVTNTAERMSTLPLEVGSEPTTQWAIFDNCSVDLSNAPPSVSLRMAFIHNGPIVNESFAISELK